MIGVQGPSLETKISMNKPTTVIVKMALKTNKRDATYVCTDMDICIITITSGRRLIRAAVTSTRSSDEGSLCRGMLWAIDLAANNFDSQLLGNKGYWAYCN